MAISKTALLDLITKHNDPTDETKILVIQSTSASNFFSDRLFGKIKIDGEDLVFTEFSNDGQHLYQTRTGIDNIDIVTYQAHAKLGATLLKIKDFLADVITKPIYKTDTIVAPLLTELEGYSLDSTESDVEAKFTAAQKAVQKVVADRHKLLEQAHDLEEVRNAYFKEFDSQSVYLFTKLDELINDLQGVEKPNPELEATLGTLKPKYETYKSILAAYFANKKSTNLTAVQAVDSLLKKLEATEDLA